MSTDQLTGTLLCIWYGFSVIHHVQSQSEQDKILTSELGNPGWWRLALARFIFFVIGITGVIGFLFFFISTPVFRAPPYIVGLSIGIILFIFSAILNKKNKNDRIL
jgi:hypothetical protein